MIMNKMRKIILIDTMEKNSNFIDRYDDSLKKIIFREKIVEYIMIQN